jgi:hypothetical protein
MAGSERMSLKKLARESKRWERRNAKTKALAAALAPQVGPARPAAVRGNK